ncbi:hypothetical protein [Sphingomicrobium lutaoense]|uniref:Secreted protein n=1 Tax=Sphingomicrobium lutaoense TaxID=515949 RepID=A0A839Z319_9SPHN|nr:hypothetical protein [Sphingomicrobium lutaoense]MBB3764467.1 hypothetical protein [Sphingomicrobium lutaoense]
MLNRIVTLAATAGMAASLVSAPASAQRSQVEVVVYGDDPCPRAAEDEIVVCKRLGEEERFRIPQEFRRTAERVENQSWAARVRYLEQNNETGLPQCTAVGPAAGQGCLQKEIDEAVAKRKQLEADETAPE